MVFSSLVFLCVFLPVVFILYTLIPNLKVRNGLLILASLLFYAYGEPVYVLLMIASSILNYVSARLIARNPERKSKAVLAAAVIVNLGILVVFKYTGMIVQTVNTVAGLQIPVPQIKLPIGISFFTFQALSYVIDVYRGVVGVQKNYWTVLLYIAFFPQLIAGPIVKYRDIDEQIRDRQQTADGISAGWLRFICGLCKKVLIANTMAKTADAVFAMNPSLISSPLAWLGAVAYLFQIYYDFSGYSDMAIGLGKMFGFTFKENFNYPYGALNIQDFWRRWHISLSTWFREYLYFPLGGNRKGKGRAILNRLIVFFCTGLWHGASWTFVLWGLWHGLFLLIEEFIPALKKLPKVIGNVYTLLVVILGFVLFRADTIGYAAGYIGQMFTGFAGGAMSGLLMEQLTPWFLVMLGAAVIGCAPIRPLSDRLRTAVSEQRSGVRAVLYCVAFAGLIWCMMRLSSGAYNPFIYFRF